MSSSALAESIDPISADAEDRADVRAWIDKLLAEGPIAYIEIHRLSDSSEERIGAALGKDSGSVVAPDKIVLDLSEQMRDDADTWGGEQAYLCYCYREDNDAKFALFRGKYHRRAKFIFWGKGEAKNHETSTDKIIQDALMGQALRHSEKMHELALSALMKMREVDDTEKKRLMRRVSDLEEREDIARKAVLEAQVQKTKEMIELEKVQSEGRMHKLLYDTLNLAAPAVMSRLLPQGAGEPARELGTVQEFFLSISMGQLQRLKTECGFEPAQLAVLGTLYEGFTQGKIPALSGEQLKRFLEAMKPSHWDAVEKILRSDQIELVKKIIAAYASEGT